MIDFLEDENKENEEENINNEDLNYNETSTADDVNENKEIESNDENNNENIEKPSVEINNEEKAGEEKVSSNENKEETATNKEVTSTIVNFADKINSDEGNEESSTIEKEKLADSLDGIYNKELSSSSSKKTNFVPLLNFDSDDDFTSQLEVKREEFNKVRKRNEKLNIILKSVIGGLLVAALIILILSNVQSGGNKLIPQAWVPITVVSICAAFSIGISIFLYIFSKKYQQVANVYFDFYQNAVASYLVKPLSLTDGKISPQASLGDEVFIQSHYFSTINAINSRGLVVGKRNDSEITFGEIAVSIPNVSEEEANQLPQLYDFQTDEEIPYKPEIYTEEQDKPKKKSLFAVPNPYTLGLLGRIFALDKKVDSSSSFIIVFRGEKKNTVMPTYVDSYKAYTDTRLKDNIVIYLASDEAKAYFTDETITLLNKIVIDNITTFGYISVNSYGSKIFFNLSDDIMTLPTIKPVDKAVLLSYIDNLKDAVDFVEAI